MKSEDFLNLYEKLQDLGYGDEISWQENLQPCENSHTFFMEACWVILNSGMKEQIARIIWDRIQQAWAKEVDISDVFKHKGKVAAINYLVENYRALFDNYLMSENKVLFLQSIPFIGKITCLHLAKNLGVDCVKPDRHLVKIANNYNTTPDLMCDQLSNELNIKKSVIDIVIWRACNLKLI